MYKQYGKCEYGNQGSSDSYWELQPQSRLSLTAPNSPPLHNAKATNKRRSNIQQIPAPAFSSEIDQGHQSLNLLSKHPRPSPSHPNPSLGGWYPPFPKERTSFLFPQQLSDLGVTNQRPEAGTRTREPFRSGGIVSKRGRKTHQKKRSWREGVERRSPTIKKIDDDPTDACKSTKVYSGTIKFLAFDKMYGFIKSPELGDIFVHFDDLFKSKITFKQIKTALDQKREISFNVMNYQSCTSSKKRFKATNLRIN